MSLSNNKGMKVIWSIVAIVFTILFIYLLQSMSFMFSSTVIQVLEYMILVFGFVAILVMW